MSLFINNLSPHQVITSSNFAKKSDIIYAEIISPSEYAKIADQNTYIVSQNESEVLYKNNNFKIKENDVIFCNTYLLDDLFNMLNDLGEFKNLKLISGQTDHKVTKKDFLKKPKCISKWFAVNVNYEVDQLIPIPLGLSNNLAGKNLEKDSFSKITPKKSKLKKIYSNFEINTNYFHRKQLLKRRYFKNEDFEYKLNKIDFDQYLKDLNKFKYILCPWGNGVDTHRIWEALYANSIPVVKNHMTLKTLNKLNAISLNNYKEMSIKNLEQKERADFNQDFLNIDTWMKLIRENNTYTNKKLVIKDDSNRNEVITSNFLKKIENERKIKVLYTLLRKIDQKLS